MANESFKEIKLVVRSKNGSKPVEWNDSELNLFSERFMEYLLQEGKDPRIEPQDYLRWYCTQMDRFDIEEGISGELEQVFGSTFLTPRSSDPIRTTRNPLRTNQICSELIRTTQNQSEFEP